MKAFLFLLLLLAGACTSQPTPSQNIGTGQCKQTFAQLAILYEAGKAQEAIDLVKSRLPDILKNAKDVNEKDSVFYYMHRVLNLCFMAYQNSMQFSAGIEYMDSLSNNPLLQKHCQYELLSSQASLHQMKGNNQEAVRLADAYLRLPTNPDAGQFIKQAEAISGVYVYSGNDLSKAVHILEKAMKAYRDGERYQNMVMLISRLGIYYSLLGEYEKAIATNQEAISTYNDSMPPRNVVIAYGEQGNRYFELGMYNHALQMNAKAAYYSMKKDSFGLGDVYRYRVAIFRKTGQKDSVFHYLKLAEKISSLQRSSKGVFINKVLEADCYLDYPDSAQKALQLALSICTDSSRVPRWARYQLNLQVGRALLKTGQDQKGLPLIEEAAQGLTDMNMMEGHDASSVLMDYYQEKGMNDAFVRCYKRNQSMADSLKNVDKVRAVAAANIRFDTQRKEKENKLLSAQVELQEQQLFTNIGISVVLLLLLILSVAYVINRRKAHLLLIENTKQEIKKFITRQQDLNRRNEQLTDQIEQAMASNNINTIRQLTGQGLLSKEDETAFRQSFAVIYPTYLPSLRQRYPQLTRNEELLAMLICMNQSTDEIALIMGINRTSVNVVRSRMRKNMELTKEASLDEVLKQYLP